MLLIIVQRLCIKQLCTSINPKSSYSQEFLDFLLVTFFMLEISTSSSLASPWFALMSREVMVSSWKDNFRHFPTLPKLENAQKGEKWSWDWFANVFWQLCSTFSRKRKSYWSWQHISLPAPITYYEPSNIFNIFNFHILFHIFNCEQFELHWSKMGSSGYFSKPHCLLLNWISKYETIGQVSCDKVGRCGWHRATTYIVYIATSYVQ